MDYLAKDLAHLAVPLLRAACDRAAQTSRGMPYAAEIIACAAAIVEERQRAAERVVNPATGRAAEPKGRADHYREINIGYMRSGSLFRMTMDGSMFRIGDPGERRTTDAAGDVALVGGR